MGQISIDIERDDPEYKRILPLAILIRSIFEASVLYNPIIT